MTTLVYAPATHHAISAIRFVLSPVVVGPLLLAGHFGPVQLPGVRVLAVVFTLGLVGQLNSWLNRLAANAWRHHPAPGWDWPSEIAVVTGGASGIGLVLVQRLAALGMRVAILDVQEPPAAAAVTSDRVRLFHCDVTSSESVASTAAAVRETFGDASILVNNAGITKLSPILDLDEAFLRRILGVNLMSMWFTTQQFVRPMVRRNKGHIVTVASVASCVALPLAADYSASKAGALSFHESLATELKLVHKAPDVLTTVVQPNFVRTPLLSGFTERLEAEGVVLIESEQVADAIVAQIKSCRGRQVFVPENMALVSGLRAWPAWAQEVVRDGLGRVAAKTMS